MRTPSRKFRSLGLALGGALLATGCGADSEPSTAQIAPRNVVLITLDTVRADALGCYGQPLPTSPRIDRLAAEGVLFQQVLSSSPNTAPSHASILTGRQPYAHGVRSNVGYALPDGIRTLAEALRAHGLRTQAEIAAPVIGRHTRLDRGFDHYRDLTSFDVTLKTVEQRDTEGRALRIQRQERPAEDITGRGLEFLRAHRDDAFFLWLHYFDPHASYEAPPRFAELVASPYLAELRYVDEQVGRVVEEIARLGLKNQTLLVLTGDHGEGLGAHGEDTHSFFVYDSVMRVPLVLWGAGLPAGRRAGSLVRTVDIAPTVLDLLGAPPLPDIQGVSLRPLLAGGNDDLGLTAYGETAELASLFGAAALRFVREGDWKYIHSVEPELYDVGRDPGEGKDLAASHPAEVARLRSRLEALLAEAPMSPAGAPVSVDAETLARLDALGYAGSGSSSRIDAALATLGTQGIDPTTTLGDLRSFVQAWGHFRGGRYAEAAARFGALWARHPASAPVLFGLVTSSRMARARPEIVVPLLRRGIELDPEFTPYYLDLARTLRASDPAEAERLLRRAVAVEPCAALPRVQLANFLRAQARHEAQLEVLEAGVAQCPDSSDFLNDTAYALATSPVDALRDGPRALELAQRAVAASGGEQPSFLDTLAAAYAEMGDYERAVDSSRRAIALLKQRSVHERVLAAFERNLERFEAGQPVREP
ncbi:MAG: sulfatase-like hydrolase/transferase [Myxococcales bacterium]|nr:sulfatase-like hydrolase/transferase [Myxococcales bacterium]